MTNKDYPSEVWKLLNTIRMGEEGENPNHGLNNFNIICRPCLEFSYQSIYNKHVKRSKAPLVSPQVTSC